MSVTITTTDTTVTVQSDYNPTWPARAKALGGRFDPASRGWRFDARDEQRVRDLCREVYGTDGQPTETVTVRINLDRFDTDRVSELYLFGRKLVTRPGRDSDVRLGNGVVIISGGFPAYGGSMKNPRLNSLPETVLEVRDVPAGHSDIAGHVDVVDTSIDRDALRVERDRLVARLAEVDALLEA